MKAILIFLLTIFIAGASFGQTAVNFTCNDCKSFSHELFEELDMGKVVVLCWVMPCGGCVAPAMTAYNVVSSFSDSHPGRVLFYLADDYADTDCSSLTSWATNNNMPKIPFMYQFSNPDVNMNGYGPVGMPKIVVAGGNDHTVFYNQNNSIDPTDLQNAIIEALNAPSAVTEVSSEMAKMKQIINNNSTIDLVLTKDSEIIVDVYSITGQKIMNAFNGEKRAGKHSINVNTSDLRKGIYLVHLTVDNSEKVFKVVI